jgi:hypothetical protein
MCVEISTAHEENEGVTINQGTTMWLLVHLVGTLDSSIFIYHGHWLSNHLYDNQPPLKCGTMLPKLAPM